MTTHAKVTVEGPVTADLILWRVGKRTRVTVVAKACVEYDASGRTSTARPTPILRADVIGPAGDVVAGTEIAPFVPAPEVMVVGRASHAAGSLRVGFRLEQDGRTTLDKHADVMAGQGLGLGPLPSRWPAPPAELQDVVLQLESTEGAAFQRAAHDQRVPEIKGTEDLVLIGLYPGIPLLRVALRPPDVEARVRCRGAVDVVPFVIDGLLVTLDDRRCSILYRGSIALRAEGAPLEVHVVGRPDPRAAAVVVQPTKTLPFAGSPTSDRTGRTSDVSATPWGGEPVKAVQPAAGALSTLPLDTEDDESMLEIARAAVEAAKAKAAAKAAQSTAEPAKPAPQRTPPAPPQKAQEAEPPSAEQGSADSPSAKSRSSSKSPWREDPAEPEAPKPPPVPVHTPKKDLNARLYKRDKR